METTVIRTKSMISNPEYLLDGWVVRFNPEKFYANCVIVAHYIRHSSSDTTFLIKAYDGPLTYNNGTSISVDNTYTIGSHTVYEYVRPKNETVEIFTALFRTTENVTRIDFVGVEFVGLWGMYNHAGSYNADYLKFQTKQIVYHPLFVDYIPSFEIYRQDIDLDLNDLAEYRIKELQCSWNKKMYGDIRSLINSAGVITVINGASASGVFGDLAVVLNAIKEAGRTSFNLSVSLAGSNVTVNGQTIKSPGNIVFDASGNWDASAIL